MLMSKLWIQEINWFGKMAKLVNFEAVEDNVDDDVDDDDVQKYK